MTLKQITTLLPNWLTSLIVGLILGSLVYLSTNQSWGWHDGVAFAAGYALNWYTTHVAEHPDPNPLGIKPIGSENSEVK